MLARLVVDADPTAALAGALARRLRFGTDPVRLLLSPAPELLPAWDHLASAPVAWERVTVWPTDAPVVSEAHPAWGWSRLWGHLAVPATFTGVAVDPVADRDGERAAARLASMIAEPPCRGVVDHAVLRLGPSGEVAALVPDSPALRERREAVAVLRADGLVHVTVTLPTLARARALSVLAVGAACRAAVAGLLAGDVRLPVGRLRHPDFTIYADPAAAG